ALTGLSRGFAFQMLEALGVAPRDTVASDVKALDQEARGALRKHGVRFGQFTIFMPALLKPAPTRLRLVLWSLARGFDEFPEAPPPGLVTVPTGEGLPEGYHSMAGYRAAGERAIRIDMLERLADMLRVQDTRGGFEATPDMLSITGMTLEQFSGLMEGLGYRAERGERVKQRVEEPAEPAAPEAEPSPEAGADAPEAEASPEAETPAAETAESVAPVESAGEDAPAAEEAAASEVEPAAATAEPESENAPEEPQMEVFYTFTWAPKRRPNRPNRGKSRDDSGGQGRQGGNRRNGEPGQKPKGKKGQGGKRPPRKQPDGAKTYSARPPAKEKKIDPDNPFAAALMGLRDKT
ncbi:MAG: disulfide oxidoreductase, partial [Mangrovicoccus sp.]|nr:disulfide oxidoreductase [Mangrovicoccus sp.]